MMQRTFFLLAISLVICCAKVYSQESKFENWRPEEIKYYNNLKGLAEYVADKPNIDISKDETIQKYLLIDEASKDSIYRNTVYGIEYRNGLFTLFSKKINEYGLNNLDAKPLRFYKQIDSIYLPFNKALKELSPDVMVYYLKGDSDRPEKPLGTLLFDPKTFKLKSWVLLKQGSSGWFFL